MEIDFAALYTVMVRLIPVMKRKHPDFFSALHPLLLPSSVLAASLLLLCPLSIEVAVEHTSVY